MQLVKSGPLLWVSPSRCALFDQPMNIGAAGLKPGQNVTIAAKVDQDGGKFESFANFVADSKGRVDLSRHSAVSGTYSGLDPMGLFFSLKQSPDQRKGLQFLPRLAERPIVYRLSLVDSFGGRVLHEMPIERHFMHPDVRAMDISFRRLRARLFCHRDGSIQPAIIDLFGTGGGLVECRAALLASKGFAVLSLPYFNYKDLPKSLAEIDLTYFEEAIEWLCDQDNTSDYIGMIGTSLGASISVLCGMRYPKLKAIVPINGLHVLDSFTPLTENGRRLHTASGDLRHMDFEDGQLRYGTYCDSLPVDEQNVFHIEQCADHTQWLFGASELDEACCSAKSARILERRLIESGKTRNVTVNVYKGAGHLLHPPFMPHCPMCWHNQIGGYMKMGGDQYAHSTAQVQMWTDVVQFFSEHLGRPSDMKPFSARHNVVSSRL